MSSKVLRKKRKNKQLDTHSFQRAGDDTVAENQQSLEQAELKNLQKNEGEKQIRVNQAGSHNKLKTGDDQTVGGESTDESLPRPYQFLKFANPPLHTIFLPHFKVKSLTFILTIILLICFIILLVYSYTKPIQNKLTWNCSIFELQNKYYPRLRFGYQFWRVLISMFFHSNIAHFVLNLIGIQIYGYFVQWYFGKVKYAIAVGLAGLLSFFLSCVVQPTTVSTSSSSILFVIMSLKLIFLYEYKDYKPLLTRRLLIYLLYLLILGINLIPIFVNNNVDFTNHIGGYITGILLGIFYHINKTYSQQTLCQKIIKFTSVILIAVVIVICIALMYALPDTNQNWLALNLNIGVKCTDPNQE